MEKKKSSFSGQIGFVLAAAGSAVGVGNLWRFPYLAAKDGGGLFLLIYLVLVLTFGFTLLTSDIAIGRRTKESAIGAYTKMHPKWKFLGILTFLVPVLIMTYYAVIGGWVTKYAVIYLTGHASDAAADGYFTSFITSPVAPVVFALLFMAVTSLVVYNGVEGGIERVSKYMMPILLVLVVVIAGYSLTLKHTDESGQLRTGVEGLLYYLTPHFEGLTLKRFLQILLDAMSQLFFSLSVSMGIMITYGSYVKPEINLNRAVSQIEVFDTGVALLAGAMIIPAVCRSESDVYFSAESICGYGKSGQCSWYSVLCHYYFCHTHFLYLSTGIYYCKLYGNFSYYQKENRTGTDCDLPDCFCGDRTWLQYLLFRSKASERFCGTVAGYHGLHQQQCYDAADRTALYDPDRMDQNTGLCN